VRKVTLGGVGRASTRSSRSTLLPQALASAARQNHSSNARADDRETNHHPLHHSESPLKEELPSAALLADEVTLRFRALQP
jgi:hypothetical protein